MTPRPSRSAPSPVYGENKVIIQYRVRDLLWRPAGRLVRFVAVIHPARGACLLMCTDTSLQAIEIIRLYGLRFKIEHTFKQAVRQIGAFTYHFWMSDMKPLRRNNGNQHLHRASLKYRNDVKRKLHAYHVFIQAGLVCQGLLQYLSVAFPQLVWSSFGSWLRTIRPGIPPSELVVATALRQRLPEFLLNADQRQHLHEIRRRTSRTPTKCRPSASPPNRKPRTLRALSNVARYRDPFGSRPSDLCPARYTISTLPRRCDHLGAPNQFCSADQLGTAHQIRARDSLSAGDVVVGRHFLRQQNVLDPADRNVDTDRNV